MVLHLKAQTFDPASEDPVLDRRLRSRSGFGTEAELWLVQTEGRPTVASRGEVESLGLEVKGYLPTHTFLCRGKASAGRAVERSGRFRAVLPYHPGFRLDSALRAQVLDQTSTSALRVNVVLVDKVSDRSTLLPVLEALGAEIVNGAEGGGLLLDVLATPSQLLALANRPEVAWMDPWIAPELDMDNARAQGGADAVETFGGYTGAGLNGHVYEGVQDDHPDFTNPPINVRSGGEAANHGHATAGIVFGNGTSNPAGRGLVPDAQPFFTNFSSVEDMVTRYQVVEDLVQIHDISFTTASWGNGRTFDYTAISADSDDIVFDHGIIWTQSQSNAGDQASRPQAWAKNVISVGGVRHGNNSDRTDDSWGGGGSTGPAADGRIKPDLSAFYDGILCSDRTGTDGYTNDDFVNGFGGTSGATPIIAGFNGLALQMFTDGLFGNSLPNPGGSRFSNRPKFTTHKALMIANARQYPFGVESVSNRREQVGWGFPDLQQMLDNRDDMLIVDESVVLTQGSTWSQSLNVPAGAPELKVCMVYADPAGNPASTIARINDLDLRLIAPDGTIYRGNVGLRSGNESIPGGVADDRDTVECVILRDPQVGDWIVEVEAVLIAMDSHVETMEVDADFGLATTLGIAESELEVFGAACSGSEFEAEVVGGVNEAGGDLLIRSSGSLHAYPIVIEQDMTLTAVEMFTSSVRGRTVTIDTAVFLDVEGVPELDPVASGTLTADPEVRFYRSEFDTPIAVTAGQTIYIGHSVAFQTLISDLASGEEASSFFFAQGQDGPEWRQSSFVDRPAIRLLGAGVGAMPRTPEFRISGVPVPGATLTRTVRQGPTNGAALVLTAFDDPATDPLGFPIELSPFGAPGCALQINAAVTESLPLDLEGRGRIDFELPASSALAGVELFQQVVLLDPLANTLGITATEAVRFRLAAR
ncbi:MAG: S8 family serine peptidase [Planctomycetota bacterium]